jgi:hypothetical protein
MPKRATTASVDTEGQRIGSQKPRTKKHIVVPATAEQISKGVGVTKKDAALVRKVMLRLGYIKEEGPAKKVGTKPKKQGHKGRQGPKRRQGQ